LIRRHFLSDDEWRLFIAEMKVVLLKYPEEAASIQREIGAAEAALADESRRFVRAQEE